MPTPSRSFRRVAIGLSMAALACGAQADWPSAGHDLKNSRYQANGNAIDSRSVGNLELKWALDVDGDVTANPAVDGQHLYFPDNKGFVYKVDKKTGVLVWKRPVSDYTGIAGDFARASPVIVGQTLILGNNSGKFLGPALGQPVPQPARVFALDKRTGQPLWTTQVDDTAMSFITHSAIVAGDVALVGLASNEELVAGFVPPPYWQWHFRGSVVALDVRTGAIRWKTYMVPDGYYGGAIWGSTGAVDMARRTVYMATGNNYAVPESVLSCLRANGSPAACMSPANHIDSVVALDLDTGALRWASKGLDYDAWNVGCGLSVPGFVIPPNDNCPVPTGPDWDFAQGPMLFGPGSQMVGAGQKSGKFWAFDARTGQVMWSTQVAPGGLTGGLQWGSASDGRRIFVAVANSGPTGSAQVPTPWTLKDGSQTTAGGWAALDVRNGSVLWTTADPLGSRAEAAVSATADVVFGCNLDFTRGTMYALDAATGRPLWKYDSGAPCNAGPSISDGMVYWGSGTFIGAPGAKKLFAFGL